MAALRVAFRTSSSCKESHLLSFPSPAPQISQGRVEIPPHIVAEAMAALRGNKGEPALDVRWSAPISENEMRYVEDYVKARYPAIFTECIVGLGFPMPCVLEEPDGGGYRGGNGGGYGGGLSPMAELLAMDDEEWDAEGEGGYGGMGAAGAVFGRSNSTVSAGGSSSGTASPQFRAHSTSPTAAGGGNVVPLMRDSLQQQKQQMEQQMQQQKQQVEQQRKMMQRNGPPPSFSASSPSENKSRLFSRFVPSGTVTATQPGRALLNPSRLRDILVESRDVLDLSMSVSVTELHARRRILQQCGVESEEYHIVFTPSVQEAMVLVAEAYPFHRHNVFLTALDQTDDSISMFATHKDSKVIQAPLSWLDLQKPGSQLSTNFRRKSKANPKGLFAYPMCANGQTFSLHWVSEAQRTCWHVLLDVTAIELDSGVFNLTSHKPDYVLCCSPHIVGYPYRLACLLSSDLPASPPPMLPVAGEADGEPLPVSGKSMMEWKDSVVRAAAAMGTTPASDSFDSCSSDTSLSDTSTSESAALTSEWSSNSLLSLSSTRSEEAEDLSSTEGSGAASPGSPGMAAVAAAADLRRVLILAENAGKLEELAENAARMGLVAEAQALTLKLGRAADDPAEGSETADQVADIIDTAGPASPVVPSAPVIKACPAAAAAAPPATFVAMQRRSATSRAVHNAARRGDVEELRALLAENPELINARSSLTCQTPLHEAAAEDAAEAIRLLLSVGRPLSKAGISRADGETREDASGAVPADVEARNMFGETPLHIAAKIGSARSVRALLEGGAAVNAAASNRATPLHLAVWAAVNTADVGDAPAGSGQPKILEVVELLLQHGADVATQDKDGNSPLSHIQLGTSSATSTSNNSSIRASVRRILDRHVALHAPSPSSQTSPASAFAVMQTLENELSSLIGLPLLKQQLRVWAKGLALDQKRRELGIRVQPRKPPHMAFLGSPGTGKTTVARVLARLLNLVGVLPTDKVVEVQRTDLVGEFVGHTGPKTRRKILEAAGGILFVDEAYRLVPQQRSDEKDYGAEALEEIMSVMDSGSVVVIFAGYAEPMKRVFAVNEGFQRRVSRVFVFDDLSPLDIAQVILLKMKQAAGEATSGDESDGDCAISSSSSSGSGSDHGAGASGSSNSDYSEASQQSPLAGFRLHPSITPSSLAAVITRSTTEEQRRQRNGGMALPVLMDARDRLDERLDLDCCDMDELVTITMEDIEAALSNIPQ
ncbi:unnamed protein product [Closterium sp. NIES-54]